MAELKYNWVCSTCGHIFKPEGMKKCPKCGGWEVSPILNKTRDMNCPKCGEIMENSYLYLKYPDANTRVVIGKNASNNPQYPNIIKSITLMKHNSLFSDEINNIKPIQHCEKCKLIVMPYTEIVEKSFWDALFGYDEVKEVTSPIEFQVEDDLFPENEFIKIRSDDWENVKDMNIGVDYIQISYDEFYTKANDSQNKKGFCVVSYDREEQVMWLKEYDKGVKLYWAYKQDTPKEESSPKIISPP